MSNFSSAESTANQFEEWILLINIRFGTWKVRRLNWALLCTTSTKSSIFWDLKLIIPFLLLIKSILAGDPFGE